MNRNNKSVILAILIITAVSIWMPKGNKPASVSADTSEHVIPVIIASKENFEFDDWGRDPFAWTQVNEQTDDTSDLRVLAIMEYGEKYQAMINKSIVEVGDKINDKTVKQIEQNRVILNDGTNDYILKLLE